MSVRGNASILTHPFSVPIVAHGVIVGGTEGAEPTRHLVSPLKIPLKIRSLSVSHSNDFNPQPMNL